MQKGEILYGAIVVYQSTAPSTVLWKKKMATPSDRRRRARVQGSWAAPPSRLPKSGSASRSQTTLDGYVKKEELTSSADKHKRVFAYAESKTALRKVPPVITIEKPGVHEISSAPNGPSRLQLWYNFLEQDDQQWMFDQLRAEIPWEERKVVIRGMSFDQPRLTSWFGSFPYTYSGLTLQPYQWSPLLEVIRDRIQAETGLTFNSMLANLYRDCKDSVDWHCDDEPSLGPRPIIASISLGDTRTFELRKKPIGEDEETGYQFAQHIKVPLPSGSLLVMSGATQLDWQHRVPKEYHDREPRINLTFRQISKSSH